MSRPSDTGYFAYKCTIAFPRPSRKLLPQPTFKQWQDARVFQLTPGFVTGILPNLESQDPDRMAKEISLHAWAPLQPLTFQTAWGNIPSKRLIPWGVLDLLRAVRDDQSNDLLPHHNIPTLLVIPGDRERDFEGKPRGDPPPLPIIMRRKDAFGRPIWELDRWDVTDTTAIPLEARLLTLA